MLFCLQSRFWDFCSKFRRDNQKLYFFVQGQFWQYSLVLILGMVLLVRSAKCGCDSVLLFSGRSSAGSPHDLQRPWSRNVDGVSCGRVLLATSMCSVQYQKYGGSAVCIVSSWPGMLKAQFWRSSHGPLSLFGRQPAPVLRCGSQRVAQAGHSAFTWVSSVMCVRL